MTTDRLWVASVLGAAGLLLAALAGAQGPDSLGEIHHIHGLAFDRKDSRTLYVATHTGLLRVHAGRPPEWVGAHRFDLMGFTTHPTEPSLVYASGHPDVATYRREKVGNLGLLVSRDGGNSWQSVALRGQADFHALTYSPGESGQLFGWSVAGQQGLFKISTKTWTAEPVRSRGLANVLSLAASPDPRGPLLAGTASGLLRSRDRGATWTAVTGLPGDAPVTAVAFHPTDARRAYAYVHRPGAGLMRSDDGAQTWKPVAAVSGAETPAVALATGRGDEVAIATAGADISLSPDGGRTWELLVQRGRRVGR